MRQPFKRVFLAIERTRLPGNLLAPLQSCFEPLSAGYQSADVRRTLNPSPISPYASLSHQSLAERNLGAHHAYGAWAYAGVPGWQRPRVGARGYAAFGRGGWMSGLGGRTLV